VAVRAASPPELHPAYGIISVESRRRLLVIAYVAVMGSTVTKIRTSNMTIIQTVQTNSSPIGITYVPDRREIWVACYTGTIMVFKDA
jgi:DNA-binding beta-propeller fold protein YncE